MQRWEQRPAPRARGGARGEGARRVRACAVVAGVIRGAARARVRGLGGCCGLPRRRAARREHGARSRRARLAGGTVSSRRTRPGPRGDGAVAAAGARANPGADPSTEPKAAGARVAAGAGECVRGAGRETFFVKLRRCEPGRASAVNQQPRGGTRAAVRVRAPPHAVRQRDRVCLLPASVSAGVCVCARARR